MLHIIKLSIVAAFVVASLINGARTEAAAKSALDASPCPLAAASSSSTAG